MGAIVGKDGYINLSGTTIGFIDTWSISNSIGNVDVTAFGDGNGVKREYTLIDASGSFSGTSAISDASQLSLITSTLSGGTLAKVDLYMYLSGAYSIYGTCLLTSVEIGSSVGDKCTFSAGWAADGLLKGDIS